MKITVQTGTGSAPARFTLGDDAKGEFISGFLPGRESLKQLAQRLRARGVKPLSRGNTQTTIPFSTQRQHVTYEGSLKFIRDHLLLCPKQGLVEVVQEGTLAFSFYLVDALIDFHFEQLEGVATKVNYTIIGGEVQAAAPESTST